MQLIESNLEQLTDTQVKYNEILEPGMSALFQEPVLREKKDCISELWVECLKCLTAPVLG